MLCQSTPTGFLHVGCDKGLPPGVPLPWWESMQENLYPNSRKIRKKVEIPRAAGYKSLPKRRKSAENVEIPRAAGCKSLPKRRKTAEKGRDSQSRQM